MAMMRGNPSKDCAVHLSALPVWGHLPHPTPQDMSSQAPLLLLVFIEPLVFWALGGLNDQCGEGEGIWEVLGEEILE